MEGLPLYTNAKYSRLSGLRVFLAADLRGAGDYRRKAQEFLHGNLVPSRLTDDLVLVIDEALTNVVRHSYEGQPNHTLQLQLFIETEEGGRETHLTVILVDRGEAGRHYSPSGRLAETLARLAAGDTSGFGLVLIHRLMDRVDYRVSPQGENRLVLHKSFVDGESDESYVSRLIHDLQDVGSLTSA